MCIRFHIRGYLYVWMQIRFSEFPESEGISDQRLQQRHISNNISRVAVKGPTFWKTNPRLWLNQLESQFLTVGITLDTTKVASVESDVLNEGSSVHKMAPLFIHALQTNR
uniref:Uncharacterized protein n=1 Tax=Glossina austeni TaxID=7395 RepID=A0A1A9UGI7_GLOAU